MSKTIVAQVTTKAQDFPAGTVDTQYVFTLSDTSGNVLQTQNVDGPSATFQPVDAGDYVVAVTKNGVSASASVTVPVDTVNLQVPDVLTVSLT